MMFSSSFVVLMIILFVESAEFHLQNSVKRTKLPREKVNK